MGANSLSTVCPRNRSLVVRRGSQLLYSWSHHASPSQFHSVIPALSSHLFLHLQASLKIHLVFKRQRKVFHWCGACWLDWLAGQQAQGPRSHHSSAEILCRCYHTWHFYLVSGNQTQVLMLTWQILYRLDYLSGSSLNSLPSHFEVLITLTLKMKEWRA